MLRRLVWLVGTVLVIVAAAAAVAVSSDASYQSLQVLCVGDFSCYGSAVKYSVALLQSTMCSLDALGLTGYHTEGSIRIRAIPFYASFPITVNISIDWREQSQPTSTLTADTSERVLPFDYEYVMINFTSGAVNSNIHQVQPSAVSDSKSTSSYFTLDETWQGEQRVDIFHAYQYGRHQSQPGVVYWPVVLVQLVTRNATWDEEQVSAWDPTTWDAVRFSCHCQLRPWFDGDDDTSCNDARYCHLSPFWLDQQGMCRVHETQAVPAMPKTFRVLTGLAMLAGVCWCAVLFSRGKRGKTCNPNNRSLMEPCST
jgi:hypothetical protein